MLDHFVFPPVGKAEMIHSRFIAAAKIVILFSEYRVTGNDKNNPKGLQELTGSLLINPITLCSSEGEQRWTYPCSPGNQNLRRIGQELASIRLTISFTALRPF